MITVAFMKKGLSQIEFGTLLSVKLCGSAQMSVFTQYLPRDQFVKALRPCKQLKVSEFPTRKTQNISWLMTCQIHLYFYEYSSL